MIPSKEDKITVKVESYKHNKSLQLTLNWDADINDWVDAFKTVLIHQTFCEDTIKELFESWHEYDEDKRFESWHEYDEDKRETFTENAIQDELYNQLDAVNKQQPVDWRSVLAKAEEQLQEARDYADRLVEHKDMVCLPADLANLREANAAFAIENHDLKERCDKLNGIILACHRAFIGGSDFVQSEARRLAEEAVNELVYNNVNDRSRD